MVSNRPYVTVLKDLEKRRTATATELESLQSELDQLDSLIAGLKKVSSVSSRNEDSSLFRDNATSFASTSSGMPSMSMRWAILTIFGRMGATAMSVSDVVEALKGMGFPDNTKLRGNASAVLSRMVGFKEVVNTGNSYTITELGRHSLGLIQMRKNPIVPDNNFTYSASAPDDEEEGD